MKVVSFAGALVSAAVLVACTFGSDRSKEGGRAQCAYGGTLLDCPEAERTVEGACWRLVDCGAISVYSEDDTGDRFFDWGECVDALERLTDDRQRLVIACIATSVCDELRVDGSPDRPQADELACLRFGDP
jgi:hypothetical protein